MSADELSRERVLEALLPVVDPEIGISVVDLGLVYDIEVDPAAKRVKVRMTLTTPMCPYGPQLLGAVQAALSAARGVDEAEVELVWDPPWDPRRHPSEEVRAMLGIWD